MSESDLWKAPFGLIAVILGCVTLFSVVVALRWSVSEPGVESFDGSIASDRSIQVGATPSLTSTYSVPSAHEEGPLTSSEPAESAEFQSSLISRLSRRSINGQPVEPRDLTWAPGAEAILESVVRSMGGAVLDVRGVECRTTYCEIVVIHDSSLLDMTKEDRAMVAESFEQELQETMKSVYAVFPRLERTSASDMILVSSGVPNVVVWDQAWVTVVEVTAVSRSGGD